MLTVTLTDRFDSVRMAFHMRRLLYTPANVQIPGFSIYSNDFRPGYDMDSLFNERSFDLPAYRLNVYRYWGIHTSAGDSSLSYGDRHVSAIRDYDRSLDRSNYGGLAPHHTALPRHSQRSGSLRWTAETDVVDKSFAVSLKTRDDGSFIYVTYSSTLKNLDNVRRYVLPPTFPDASRGYSSLNLDLVLGLPTFTISRYQGYVSSLQSERSYVPFLVEDIDDRPITFNVSKAYARNTLIYSEFDHSESWDEEDGHATCRTTFSYKFTNQATSTRTVKELGYALPVRVDTYRVTYEVFSDLYALPGAFSAFVGAYDLRASTNSVHTYTLTYELLDSSGNCTPPPSYPWKVLGGSWVNAGCQCVGPILIETPNTNRSGTELLLDQVPVLRGIKLGENVLMERFSSAITAIHQDMRSSACLSSNDALKQYESSSNFLESIPELPQVFAAIKDVARIGKVLKLLYKRDPRVIKEFIDLMADGYLMYKYGAKPLASDIKEAKSIAEEYYRNLDVLSKGLPRVLYGKFTYEVPRDQHKLPGNLLLTTRSKMSLYQSPGGIVGYILALDGVGLLPTLARIWDLVPFSFIIDWFTNLGDRYAAIDSMVVRSLLEVDYYVHTYTYKLYLDPDTYAPLTLKSPDPYLKIFLRERSRFHPLMRTDQDFFPPTGLKNRKLAAGALLWSSV